MTENAREDYARQAGVQNGLLCNLPSKRKQPITHLRAASTAAMGFCSHCTSFGSRMMSGSAKRLNRKGCTSSGRSGPPRFKRSTPSLSSWPLPNACAAGVGASPLLFALPHSQFLEDATMRWLVLAAAARLRPRMLPLVVLASAASPPAALRRLLCAVEENGGDDARKVVESK